MANRDASAWRSDALMTDSRGSRRRFIRDAIATTAGVAAGGGIITPNGRADDRRDSGEVLQLLRPITQTVRGSVAQVMRESRVVSLATAVERDGYLVTKRSELSGDPIRVRLSDNRIYPARVAAVRRQNDLALLSIDATVDLPPIKFEPFLPAVGSFLITPGRTGRPIGIGVMGARGRRIVPRGGLGVYLQDGAGGRAQVSNVVTGSGAEAAGLIPGDIIVSIDGTDQPSSRQVRTTLRQMYPGEQVRLTVIRQPDGDDEDRRVEMAAEIRDLGILGETENDSLVNGPRNNRISGFDRVIQHDTVLDPDECGGPLMDTSGRVIGLNIARAGRVMTFALPASLMMGETAQMLREAKR